MVPPVDNAEVAAAISRKEPSVSPPMKEAKEANEPNDDDLYDDQGQDGDIAVVRNPLHGPQGVAQRVQGASQDNRSSTSQQMGQGLQLSQGDASLQDTASGTTGSESTHLTVREC